MRTNPRSIIRDAGRRFPVRLIVAVPPLGLGERLNRINTWLDENCGADGCPERADPLMSPNSLWWYAALYRPIHQPKSGA